MVFPGLKRPTEPTVYPPGAELVFPLAAAVAPDSLLGWRLLMLAGEVATGVLLLGLLRRMKFVPFWTLLLREWRTATRAATGPA